MSVLVALVSPAKTADPIEIPLGGADSVGPRIDGSRLETLNGNGQFWREVVQPIQKHC